MYLAESEKCYTPTWLLASQNGFSMLCLAASSYFSAHVISQFCPMLPNASMDHNDPSLIVKQNYALLGRCKSAD